MRSEKTDFEWSYTPLDFFEATYSTSDPDYVLSVDNGRVVATLLDPQDPVDSRLDLRIRSHADGLFAVREMQTHRPYELSGPSVRQDFGDHQNVTLQVSGSAMSVSSACGSVDLIQRDASGRVIRDTRAERIAADAAMLDDIAPKLARSPGLRGLVDSYSRAVGDPDDELIHLYEVRDALAGHFGSETAARSALSISRSDWSWFGKLANEEPLQQGRHRGKHRKARRPASSDELDQARALARAWIAAFAATVL